VCVCTRKRAREREREKAKARERKGKRKKKRKRTWERVSICARNPVAASRGNGTTSLHEKIGTTLVRVKTLFSSPLGEENMFFGDRSTSLKERIATTRSHVGHDSYVA